MTCVNAALRRTAFHSRPPADAPRPTSFFSGRRIPSCQRYRLRIARPEARALAELLPEKVAAAAYKFITGPLLDDPDRVGKPLNPPMAPALDSPSRQLPDLKQPRRPERNRRSHGDPSSLRRVPNLTSPFADHV